MIKDAIVRICLSRRDEALSLKERFWEVGSDSFRADSTLLGESSALLFMLKTAWAIDPVKRRTRLGTLSRGTVHHSGAESNRADPTQTRGQKEKRFRPSECDDPGAACA